LTSGPTITIQALHRAFHFIFPHDKQVVVNQVMVEVVEEVSRGAISIVLSRMLAMERTPS